MAEEKEGYSNVEMLRNQANTISHHAEELQQTVKKRDQEVMPWVITKAQRASTDLSDVTHYLEGEEDNYKAGGSILSHADIDDFDSPHELAVGGKLEVGRTYTAKDGNSYRFVGGDYFMDASRNYVKKSREDFEGAIFMHGGVVDESDIVPGARLKNPSGTVFIIDDVKEEVSGVDGVSKLFVYSSLEGGAKGNYRDTLKDFTEFMNEEKAKPVMAGGGEAEDGGFYIYGKTQRDNYEIAKMLRELEIPSEWDAAEGRFRILEDDEYGDLGFRLQQEMDDRPVYGRIERVMKWGGYAEHGMELDDEDDLFDKWEELPDEVQEVLDEYSNEEPNASNIEDMRGRLNALGYDFEYGLDYSPYGLRKMEDVGETLAEGGGVKLNDIFEKYPEKDYYVSTTRVHDDMPGYATVYKKTGKKSDSGRDMYEDEFTAKYIETKALSGKYTPVKNKGKMEGGGKTKYWIQGATKKKGALRAEAKRMGLIKGDEKLTMEDLKKLEAKGGKTAQRARLAMTLQKMRGGGKVKFKDKVDSVKKSLLERKKVPKSVQKDYGKTYSPAEAQESAQRIVGAQTARERLMMRIKKGKKKK